VIYFVSFLFSFIIVLSSIYLVSVFMYFDLHFLFFFLSFFLSFFFFY
jgi:hypothetical protein